MADKNNPNNKADAGVSEDFQSSFGVNASVPEPIATGDAHANRHADNTSRTDDEPTNYPKSKMMSDMLTKLYTASGPELTGLYQQFMKLGGGTESRDSNLASITPKNKPVAEDLDTVFAGLELSEGARGRALTIFEAAVNAKMIEEKTKLDEEFETRLEKELDEQISVLAEQIDTYLSY